MVDQVMISDLGPDEQCRLLAGRADLAEMGAEAEACGDWERVLDLTPSGQRLPTLVRIASKVTHETYWALFGQTWQHEGESFYRNRGAWMALLRADRPCREAMMDREERAALALLPPAVPVWRGTKSARDCGCSWSTDRKVAEGFARDRLRHQPLGAPHLWSGSVARDRIIAYLLERHEFEVVVDPQRVSNRRCAVLP